MAVFKCKMCGADLNVSEDIKIAVCEYCGSTQTLPAIDNEKKLNLFNRANHLRRGNDFDRAAAVYENIVAEFPEEAEAYWGLCLCNYGIEYVDDPVTGEKKPTCHRASFDSLQKDDNFKLALDYADISARKVYRDEAREIDRIMEEILSISKNEKPYDVFICYKENDGSGERTTDSVLAQDIYEALTAKGLKVFFSRITLEDKLGTAYEPYIFAALNSAKVMLAVGTRYEYFNAVWVRNEWSRFLKLMLKDKSKVLIPCFKDIAPYDIPEEFSHLQAQDMSKIGYIQDLVHGVLKITGNTEIKKAVISVSDDNDRIRAILERAKMFLEDGNFRKANDVFEQALNVDLKNAQAYLGKLLADTECKDTEQLMSSLADFSDNENYKMILRFGDSEIVETVNECLEKIKENITARDNDRIYGEAIKKLEKGDIDSIKAAAEAFNSIKSWKDSDEKLELCRKRIEEIHNKKLQAIKLKSREKKIRISLVAGIILTVAIIVFVVSYVSPKIKYDNALRLMENGEYEAAISIFYELKDFSNADDNRLSCLLFMVDEMIDKQQYDKALSLLEGDYGRSRSNEQLNIIDQKRQECFIAEIDAFIAEGNFEEAQKMLYRLSDYTVRDEKEREIEEKEQSGNYSTAMQLLENGDKLGAYELLSNIPDNKAAFEKAGELRLELNRNILRSSNVGDIVIFGAYDIDGEEENGKEEISWVVLDKQDGKILVISEQVLFFTRYSDYTNVTWASSSLRTKLNNEFYNDAFSESEKALIPTVTLVDEKNGRDKGVDTQDKIFVLSMSEAKKYFSTNYDRICSPTARAKRYSSVQQDDMASWWLRTVGSAGASHNTYIHDDGTIYNGGTQVTRYDVGVRPALWISVG